MNGNNEQERKRTRGSIRSHTFGVVDDDDDGDEDDEDEDTEVAAESREAGLLPLLPGAVDVVVVVAVEVRVDENCCRVFLTLSKRTGSLECNSFCKMRCVPISLSLS